MRIPLLLLALLFTLAARADSPLVCTNGWSSVEARPGALLAPDRKYEIVLLPAELRGAWLLQRDWPSTTRDLNGEAVLASPSLVYAVIMWRHNARTEFPDTSFTRLEAEGWEYVEDDFTTTTFNSEHWGFQVMRARRPAGPLRFKAEGAYVFFLAKPEPAAPASPP